MISRLGIIGGVGPLATAHFYRRLIELTGAPRDDGHLPVVIVAERVPSRIDHLLGRGPSPVPALRRAARTLASAGADAIAIPSATTHAYRSEILDAGGVPVLDLLSETGAAIARGGWRAPLFLATTATIDRRLYEPFLPAAVPAVYPAPAGRRQVGELIDRVKRGDPPGVLRAELCRLLRSQLAATRADVAVLACTELSVIAPAPGVFPVLDVCDVLARSVSARAVSARSESARPAFQRRGDVT